VSKKFVVARADELEEGGRLIVEVNGHAIGVFKIDGEYHALLNRCPHAGGELCKGTIVSALDSSGPGDYHFDQSRKFLACPWHGWEFDIETGQSYFDPARTRVRSYRVEVQDGELVASGIEDGEVQLAPSQAPQRSHERPSHGLIEGPYRAETFPIAVEDEYLVVTMGRAEQRLGLASDTEKREKPKE
jgi:nitrite reductase/ring-hydroxylating ferredoxin subunit